MNQYPPASYLYPYGPAHHEFDRPPMIPLQEAIKGYVRFKQAKGKDSKTVSDIELSLNTLNFVRPDIQYLHQITKRLIFEYEILIAELPANYRKTARFRNLSFEQLRVAAWEKPKLSPASLDKYTLTLRAFVSWCQDTDRMPAWKLPKFESLDKGRSKDKRHPFNAAELQKLFISPMFTGHAPDLKAQYRRHEKGDYLVKDCQYWVPLIGLYTGMRLREIIQLLITDVRYEGEAVYLDVNEDGDGKSLKNASSRRQVPVHRELIALGFLKYVGSIHAAGHQRIFHDAPATAAGSPGDITSKRFSRYLASIGIKHKKLSFHSLRHTFIDQTARQARLADHIIKALVGHADHTITFGTYGGRLTIGELSEAINKISFKDIVTKE